MNKPSIHLLLTAGFVLLLAVPTVQKSVTLVPPTWLGGVEEKIARPEWTMRGWLDGRYQDTVERRYRQRFSLRGHMVKTWNQLHYALFGRPPRRPAGTEIVIGVDNYLFEESYIQTYNRPGRVRDATLREVSHRVRAAQDLLAARGIACLVVISPSKVEILPELVPPGWLQPGRAERKTVYDRMMPLLREAGVRHLDFHALFQEWKRESDQPLFPKAGTHWNYHAAARAAGLILDTLETQSGRPFPGLAITGVTTNDQPAGTDRDLLDTLNLWGDFSLRRSASFRGRELHPHLELVRGPDERRPNLLFVGDSFALTLTEVLDRVGLCGQRDTLYYFKRILRYRHPDAAPPAGPVPPADEPFDPTAFDLEAALRGRDAVILEINEQQLPNIGFGFVEALLRTAGPPQSP